MLQWMGGSRRKVTTSRKSTHKRQKQYFEQRKRQQQQESTWKDDSSDMINTSTQRPTNYQSLDILSMLDLSTSAQEHRSTCNSERESLDGDILTLDCHTTPELSISHASQEAPADRTECRGESYQWKTVYPEKVSMTFSGSHHKDLSESAKAEQLEMPNDSQLSVLDLLGDDGPNINLKGSSLHEAHVAFSVEGLGNVEMHTPEHSPQQPVRRFPRVSSTSSRERVKIPPLKIFTSGQDDLAAEADCLIEDDEFSSCKSDIYPRCMMNSISYSKQKNLMNKGCLEIVDNGPHSKNGVGNEYTFSNENKNDHIWADIYSSEKHIENDYASQYVNMNTNRECEKEMNTRDILDPVAPYGKHQILENHLDLTNSDGTCFRCPDLGRTPVTRSVNNQPAWSCFKTEDEREILSFLSEESCPSNAVWDEAIRNPPSDSLRKNIRANGSESCYAVRKKGLNNIYSHETHCTEQDDIRCRDRLHELGYSPTPAASFPKRKGPHKNWLFEHEHVNGNGNSGLDSFCNTFGVIETQPSTFQHWNEDLYDVDFAPNIQVDAKLFSESSLGDFETRHSPFCSDKVARCSSSAIWDKAVRDPPLDFLGKKIGQDGSECYCPIRKKGTKNIFSHETYCIKQDNIHESGNCPTATVNFQKRKGPHESSLFAYEDTTAKRNSGLGTFNHFSEVKDSQPSKFQHWNKDLYNVDSVPKIQDDAKLSPEISWSDFHTEHSSFFSERMACCDLKTHKHSSETNCLPETSSKSIQSTVSPVFDVGGDPQYPFRDIVSHSDIPVCESDYLNREKEQEIIKANYDKAELHEDACDGSNCLSSENKYSGDALDAGDSCSHFDVTEDRTQDMEGLTETCSPEKEYVLSIKGLNAADKIESDLDRNEEDNIVFGYQKNDQIHLSQKNCKDIVKSRPKEGNTGSKTQNITNSVSRVMMCEGYVLQYLSVHVLKKASNWAIGKNKLQGT